MNITKNLLEKFQKDYENNPDNLVIEGAIANVGINQASQDPNLIKRHNFLFSHVTKRGEITNQKSSGRCWMFSALNVARIDTMKKLDLKTFEFSQNYTLFYDKLEKSNYFLDSIIKTLDEAYDSRIIMHLLSNPIQDGGQWDMFSGLLEKYGAVPKYTMPETFHSSNTNVMTSRITSKLREYAYTLRKMYQDKISMDNILAKKEEMLSHIYSILVKCLGVPPQKFDYQYYDKDEKYHIVKDLTPQQFFNEYVGWDLNNKVSLINAPTETKPFYKAYSVKFLGSILGVRPIRYINVPIEVLKKATIASIKDGHPVWFGCDVGKQSDNKLGIMDKNAYLYDRTLNCDCKLTKGLKLDYGESLLTHAMVFTGVDLDENDKPIKWQVENSWGGDVGQKGIFSMSDNWFDEYNYQVVVDKKYIDQEILNVLNEPIIELEPWDPLGALALVK